MKTHYQSLLVAIGALALAATAFSQVPASNDTSTTDGLDNTGMGTGALGGPTPMNLTGGNNTASGYQALHFNQTGIKNTASGYQALYSNVSGNENTASGYLALWRARGNYNTASGAEALTYNTSGTNNTATGYLALHDNSGGALNTASGVKALYGNRLGNYNTASGFKALYGNGGDFNIAEGYQAGFAIQTGSNNIDIGNPGDASDGTALDSGVIRIGTQVPRALQTNTYIAGIYTNTSVSGLAVVIDSDGQLGVTGSSERFKTAITPMGSNSAKLGQLRPVTFHLKTDPQGVVQYGLIAEEVAKVYPELVIRNESGRIDGVRYDELAPMLLNEVQQLQQRIADQDEKISRLMELAEKHRN